MYELLGIYNAIGSYMEYKWVRLINNGNL
jgi:hypothetical protein